MKKTFIVTHAISKRPATICKDAILNSFSKYLCLLSVLVFTAFFHLNTQAQAYRAQFTAMSVPSTWCAGVAQNVTVTVTNNGTATWTDASPDVNIGCKWNADADYHVRVNAGGLAPGASRTYTLTMTAPTTPGSNNLTFDVVREGVCWFAWNTGGCGTGNSVYTSSAVTIQSASTAPTAISGTTTVCSGTSTTLTASGGTAGTGATFQWYAGGCGTGSVLGTGASITVTPTSTTTYYVRRTNTCNTTACFSTTVTVHQPSNVGTFSNAGPINFCNGGGNFTTPVTVNSPTGSVMWDWGSNNGVWNNNWVSGTASGVCCFPKQISASDGTADRMRVRVTNGLCATATSSTILIRELANEEPTSLTSTINNTCEGISGTLTATFPTVINMRGTVEFFSGSCGGTLIASVTPTGGTSVSTSFTPPAGTTTYYARYNPGTGTGCSATTTACASVTVNVTPSSTNPTGISGTTSICSGSSTTLTQTGGSLASGADYYWYAGTCAGVFTQDWATQPYGTANTTVNSTTGSVLRVTSTSNDPMINMYSLGSFNPAIYKNIQIRYRVITGAAGVVEIFFTNGLYASANGAQRVASGALNNDGAWHIVNIDMSTHANWTHSNVTGWRYDWATTSGVTMEIDYIMLEAPVIGTGNSITVSPTSNTTYYVRAVGDCKANNTVGCVSTTVSVSAATVGGTVSPASQTICTSAGGVVPTQHTLSGHTGSVVRWEYRPPAGGGPLAGGFYDWGGTTTTAPGNCCFSTAGTWQVRALIQNGACSQVLSSTANIIVNQTPSAVTVTPSPASGCGSVTLSTSGGTPGTIYWQNTTNNGTSTATPLTSQTVTTNGTYYFRAENSGCWSTQGSSVVSIYNLTGTFSYSNPTTCGNSGTITVSGVSGGSGTYEYSRDNGSTWQSSATFSTVPQGTHTVQVRNSTAPNCATTLGSCTLYQPHSPIAAVPTVSNSGPVCPANTITLTASGLAPGSGGSNSGGAYTFNGSTQYMNSTTSAGLPTGSIATVEAWINRNASQADGSYNGIVSWGPRACSGTSMLFSIQNTGRLSMATWCNDFVPGTGPIVPASTWTHVALVLNGTSVTFYINGQIAQTGTLSSTPAIQAAAAQAFNIGSTDNPGRYFGGSIDNVRIWSVARSQSEIQNDMYKQVPTSGTIGTNLKAIYNFNANTNNSYGTGPNLTAINAPSSITPAYYTYSWSNGGGAPNPTSGTNEIQTTPVQNTAGTFGYSVTASANSCSGTASSATNVVIHPNPSVSISADYCYIGGKVLLSAVSNITPATYAWNTGATTQDLLVDIAGTYQVTVTVSATGCTGTALRSVAQELIVNGDFSAGVSGFTTAAQYTNQQSFYITGNTSSGLYPEGKYAVNTWATSYHPIFFGVDHTSGTGNFMMVNGSAATSPPVVWQQGPVTVLPNTDYYFSAWAMSLNNVPPYAELRFSVNGTQVGTTAILTAGPSSTAGIAPSNWVRFYGVWNSGSTTSAIVSIVDNQLAAGGNDFGLDDISFGTLSTFIELISATGTDAQTSCINYPIDNIVYKVGSGPTGPVVTGLPPGVTSFFNGVTVTLSGTPTVAGTYNYTLAITGNCAPAYAYGTITVRPTQSASTWIGSSTSATKTDWFDAKNWSDCVPGTITTVTIPNGRPSYPVITNTSTFDFAPKGKAKADKVDLGSTGTGATPSLNIQSGAELRVNE